MAPKFEFDAAKHAELKARAAKELGASNNFDEAKAAAANKSPAEILQAMEARKALAIRKKEELRKMDVAAAHEAADRAGKLRRQIEATMDEPGRTARIAKFKAKTQGRAGQAA